MDTFRDFVLKNSTKSTVPSTVFDANALNLTPGMFLQKIVVWLH